MKRQTIWRMVRASRSAWPARGRAAALGRYLLAFRIADLRDHASFPLMSRLLSRQFRHCSGLLGLLVAVLAVVSQLALGAIVLPDNRPGDPIGALDALSMLCRTGHPVGDKPVPTHRRSQAALYPLSVTLALPAAIPTLAAMLPAPPVALVLRIAPPPRAHTPPSVTAIAAYPRGPPVLA